MEFTVKKIDSCFANSANFQYGIGVNGEQFMNLIDNWESLRVNEKLRRPTFIGALADGVQVKGILVKNFIRVGYPEDGWEGYKEAFEKRLAELDESSAISE